MSSADRNQDAEGKPGAPPDRPARSPSWLPASVLDPLLQYHPVLLGRSPYLLIGLGVGLASLALAQPIVDPEPAAEMAFEVAVPLAGAAVVLYAGWWTTTVERGAQKHASAVIVSLTFMAIAMGTVGVILLTQLPSGVGFDWPFAVATSLTVGALVGIPTGFVFDEVVARQTALEAEYRETKRLNQRLQVVNRVIRHNIRNELTVALGGIEIARSHVASPEATDWADRSTSALERLHDHAEKVLQIDTLEQSTDARTTIDIVGYVSSYLQARQFEAEAVHVETDLPPTAAVRAHPLIGTAIIELIENAIVHNDEDGLVVSVRMTTGDDSVEVSVADTGTGIPPLELESLERGEEAPLSHGEGVGLWLTKWVTEASDGDLRFEANQPTGTIVRLELPRAS